MNKDKLKKDIMKDAEKLAKEMQKVEDTVPKAPPRSTMEIDTAGKPKKAKAQVFNLSESKTQRPQGSPNSEVWKAYALGVLTGLAIAFIYLVGV